MLMAHKIALAPNNVQATYLSCAAGCARFAYNWALAEWQRQYQEGGKPTEAALRRQLNRIKREQFPWMMEVTKNAPQMAIRQLGQAFRNFFAGRTAYPRFRKKGVHDRFSLSNDQFRLAGSRIRIPNLGWVRMREPLRFDGKIMSATVSRVADRWYASITIDVPDSPRLPENQDAVGIDLGVSSLATLSTGEKQPGAKPHKALLRRMKRLSRSLSRKQTGSNNRRKAQMKLARLHGRIANIRRDNLHQFTTRITREYGVIGMEDLHVKGMMRNRHLARSIADMSFHELRRQLTYKAQMQGGKLVVADRWFASSKTCSACGHKQDGMTLWARQWSCPACDTLHDRDINAAKNLKEYAVSSTVSACGEESSGSARIGGVKLASVKQESSKKLPMVSFE